MQGYLGETKDAVKIVHVFEIDMKAHRLINIYCDEGRQRQGSAGIGSL